MTCMKNVTKAVNYLDKVGLSLAMGYNIEPNINGKVALTGISANNFENRYGPSA